MFFFFNDTATTEIYTLSLHDALPISAAISPPRLGVPWCRCCQPQPRPAASSPRGTTATSMRCAARSPRSEEHTSELQSRQYLVCRLLLEKQLNSSHANISYAVFCMTQ